MTENGQSRTPEQEQLDFLWDVVHNMYHCMEWPAMSLAENTPLWRQARLERVRNYAAAAMVTLERQGGRKAPHNLGSTAPRP